MSHLNALLSQMEKSEEASKQRSSRLFIYIFIYLFIYLFIYNSKFHLCFSISFALSPSFLLSFYLIINLVHKFSRSLSAIASLFLFSSTNTYLILTQFTKKSLLSLFSTPLPPTICLIWYLHYFLNLIPTLLFLHHRPQTDPFSTQFIFKFIFIFQFIFIVKFIFKFTFN